jgi:hypothetical protein
VTARIGLIIRPPTAWSSRAALRLAAVLAREP